MTVDAPSVGDGSSTRSPEVPRGIGSAGSRWPRWLRWLVVALAVLPVVIAMTRLVSTDWRPTSDDALIELQVADVGPHTPLTGVYSRLGFHHPGPALFVTLAPTYRLFGPKGLLVGAGLVNAVAMAGCALLLWRRDGPALAFAGTALLLVVARAMAGEMLEPWNPWIAMFPFGLFLLLAFTALVGEWWALPVLVGVGAWLVQAHVVYAVPVVWVTAVVGSGVAVHAWRRRRTVIDPDDPTDSTDSNSPTDLERDEDGAGARPLRWYVVVAGAVFVVAWLPALVDQLHHDPGNLTLLWRALSDPTTTGETITGRTAGAGIVAREIGALTPWMSSQDDVDPFLGAAVPASLLRLLPLVGFSLLGYAATVRARRRHPELSFESTRLQLVAVVGLVAGWLALSRIVGPSYVYLVRWLWMVGAIAWLGAGWSLVRGLAAYRNPSAHPTRGTVIATVVLCVVSSLTASVAAARADLPGPSGSRGILAVAPPVAETVRDRGLVLVGLEGDDWGSAQAGVVAELERLGVDVAVDDAEIANFGSRRGLNGRTPDIRLVVSAGDAIARRTAAGQSPLVAYDPLPPDERREYNELHARLAVAYNDVIAGRPMTVAVTDEERTRLAELAAPGSPIAVFRES